MESNQDKSHWESAKWQKGGSNVCKREICKSQIQGNCRLYEISLFEVVKIDRGNREALVTDASLLYIEWNILKLYDMC